MSNENKHAKPTSRAPADCPLIGEDGNIFNLVKIAAKILRKNGMKEEALSIIGEYVNITSVDEPSEDMDMRME